MSTDPSEGMGGTIRTRKAMPFKPTPITGVSMFSCVQPMSGCGMTFHDPLSPAGGRECDGPISCI